MGQLRYPLVIPSDSYLVLHLGQELLDGGEIGHQAPVGTLEALVLEGGFLSGYPYKHFRFCREPSTQFESIVTFTLTNIVGMTGSLARLQWWSSSGSE